MERVKFAVFTDLHYEHIHDGYKRLQNFITNVKTLDIDFVIQLGDFCTPKNENRFLLQMFDTIEKPHYHVIGNHDSDLYSREEVLNFFQINSSYYSFKKGIFKFIVLDTCFIKADDGYRPYYKKNYDKTKDIYPVLPDYEFRWLEDQLNDDSKYYILFSHHSFENEFAKRGVYNRFSIRDLINKINSTDKKVLLCVNGHDHGDSLKKIGQTYYFGLNSISYIWVGPQYEHFSYSNEIHKQYPFLKDLVLYEEGLYAIVTITRDGLINIEGIKGNYQNITPKELGLSDMWNGRPILPIVSSLKSEQCNFQFITGQGD